jgi:hypothetical protein
VAVLPTSYCALRSVFACLALPQYVEHVLNPTVWKVCFLFARGSHLIVSVRDSTSTWLRNMPRPSHRWLGYTNNSIVLLVSPTQLVPLCSYVQRAFCTGQRVLLETMQQAVPAQDGSTLTYRHVSAYTLLVLAEDKRWQQQQAEQKRSGSSAAGGTQERKELSDMSFVVARTRSRRRSRSRSPAQRRRGSRSPDRDRSDTRCVLALSQLT